MKDKKYLLSSDKNLPGDDLVPIIAKNFASAAFQQSDSFTGSYILLGVGALISLKDAWKNYNHYNDQYRRIIYDDDFPKNF